MDCTKGERVALNVMDICTGIGGFSLALKHLVGGFQTVCYVEWDKYCQQVIQQRITDGYLDDAPIWGDLREFDGQPWRGCVDIITAGFPCQPFSVAGKQRGEADERNLWPDLWRTICEVRPQVEFLENVPALLANEYGKRVFGDLAEGGYDCRWRILSAAEVGAPHKRDRLWIFAYTTNTRWAMANTKHNGERRRDNGIQAGGKREVQTKRSSSVADTTSKRHKKHQHKTRQATRRSKQQQGWWTVEPNVGRVAHGIPKRVDRLKALGNAVVPAVVAKAWEVLIYEP